METRLKGGKIVQVTCDQGRSLQRTCQTFVYNAPSAHDYGARTKAAEQGWTKETKKIGEKSTDWDLCPKCTTAGNALARAIRSR